MTFTEENYIKAIYQLSIDNNLVEIGNNILANYLKIKPATANSMLQKLKSKSLINYHKYGKISLTSLGMERAIYMLRKHRLWETFLYQTLEFTWDEVHDIAEQLEHIKSDKLIDKLDKYLNYPNYDPHGDNIPNALGEIAKTSKLTLQDVEIGKECKIVGVKDKSTSFLQLVDKLGLKINIIVRVLTIQSYDNQTEIEVMGNKITISKKISENLIVI